MIDTPSLRAFYNFALRSWWKRIRPLCQNKFNHGKVRGNKKINKYAKSMYEQHRCSYWRWCLRASIVSLWINLIFTLMQVSTKSLVNLSINRSNWAIHKPQTIYKERMWKKAERQVLHYRRRASCLYCVLPGLGMASIAMTLVFRLLKVSDSFLSV